MPYEPSLSRPQVFMFGFMGALVALTMACGAVYVGLWWIGLE